LCAVVVVGTELVGAKDEVLLGGEDDVALTSGCVSADVFPVRGDPHAPINGDPIPTANTIEQIFWEFALPTLER
jgi:hypothetical protein